MPFTFSHPAIVIPFYRSKRISALFAVLVIASMAPDFEYFLRLKIDSQISHTILGQFLFCLPAVFVVFILWKKLILPQLFNNQSQEFIEPSFRNVALFVILSITGSFSHIVWDSFTHSNGYFVEKYSLFTNAFYGFPLYKLLQHGSTLLGALVILWFTFKNKNELSISFNYYFLLKSFVLSILILLGMYIITPVNFASIGRVIVTVIPMLFYSICLVALWNNLFRV